MPKFQDLLTAFRKLGNRSQQFVIGFTTPNQTTGGWLMSGCRHIGQSIPGNFLRNASLLRLSKPSSRIHQVMNHKPADP
jgi:hypothetical protein